ncbi:MAG: HEPN domain-containing protein [Candidatus Neomarinimicrobiota bacterium]
MAHERLPPDDPREWLNRARSNLARAKAGAVVPEVYLEDPCFDAQQAAEKAVKAVLIHRDIPFPYIHDLAELLRLVESGGESVSDRVKQAGRLTRFAFATRYPGPVAPVSLEEYERAVAIAETVLRWAEECIGKRPQESG